MGWTLGIAFVAIASVLAWRLRGNRAKQDPRPVLDPAGTFRIHGRVEVTDDCSESGDGLPEMVRVAAVLTDGKRRREEATTEVALDAAPGRPNARQGTYALDVSWNGATPPLHWEPPHATRTDGTEICDGLGCDRFTRCANLATRPRRIDVMAMETEHMLRVACICVPE